MRAPSLDASSGGYSLLVCRLLIVAAYFLHRLQDTWASVFAACDSVVATFGLQSTGSAVVAHGLAALRHMGSSGIRDGAMSPALAGGFFTTEPPGKP